VAWRKSERERADHKAEQQVFATANGAAKYFAAFSVEIEAHLWRAVRAGLDLPFSDSADVEADNAIWHTVVCDLEDTSPGAVLMRSRLVQLANRLAKGFHGHPTHVREEDAVLAWMQAPQLWQSARRRVAAAWVRHLEDGSGTDTSLSEPGMFRMLRARAQAARNIIDGAVASIGVVGIGAPRFRYLSEATAAFLDTRQRINERALARRRIADGARSYSLLQVKEWSRQRDRAEMCVAVEGLHQIADARGYVSVAVHVTLPAEFHNGDRSYEEQRQAINARIAGIRARLWEMHAGHKVDSWHADRASAEARRDAIRADGRWTARIRRAETALDPQEAAASPWPWIVLAAEKVGRDALGVLFAEPHEDGTPHLHGSIRCDASIAADLVAWLCSQGDDPHEIVAEVRDGSTARKASNYAGKRHMRDDEEAEAVREWCRERGLRPVRWIGVRQPKTAWRAIYGADLEEITVGRARVVKLAMTEKRWGDALIEIGAVRSARSGRPPLRLVYEADGIGAPDAGSRRRVVGVEDPLHPEEGLVPLRPLHMAWEAQQEETENSLSAPVRCPRDGADQVEPDDPPDPIAWLDAAE